MERSNTYIFIYSVVMVVLVAAVLSFTSFSLKDLQNKNIAIEKKQNILKSLNIDATPDEAETMFDKYIAKQLVIGTDGKEREGLSAFDLDLKKEYSKSFGERNLPVYLANKEGKRYVILPVRGKGLWGPIWGFLSFEEDMNTVFGATFDHQGETPGLGAEINKAFFQKQFIGKQIFDNSGEFTSIKVIKGGAAPDNIHGVDAISGGTITSKGVDAMLDTCFNGYKIYLKSQI